MDNSTHYFTSVAANYVPKARTLAWSLKKHNPYAKFHLVLSDRIPVWLTDDISEFDSIITVDQLDIPDLERWLFKHSLVEICTGVKGAAFNEIMRRHDPHSIIYFDPDIAVMSSMETLQREFYKYSVLLTPHLTEPEKTEEAILDNELCAMKHGIYNLGFLGVKNSTEGRRFLNWWNDRLMRHCYDNKSAGLFTDQRWIDFAPAMFNEVGILRNPGYNVATWNITNRIATGSVDDGILINGLPLIFYHFSGIDSGAQEAMLNKYGKASPVLFELREWYLEQCENMGQSKYGKTTCAYHNFENGSEVTNEHRRLYNERQDLQETFPHPYKADSYYNWFLEHSGIAVRK